MESNKFVPGIDFTAQYLEDPTRFVGIGERNFDVHWSAFNDGYLQSHCQKNDVRKLVMTYSL